jgi:hypothetical protein
MAVSTRAWLRTAALSAGLALLAPVDAVAQRAAARSAATSAPVSVSGIIALGFDDRDGGNLDVPADIQQLLAPGSSIAPAARPLVERLWRSSPTFRRQCARLAAARAVVIVSLDFPRHASGLNARTEITRNGTIHAHVHLRAVDQEAAEFLGHELEHVLEQLDEVDLARAVVDGVHGVYVSQRPATFETARASAVGQIVAREARWGTR